MTLKNKLFVGFFSILLMLSIVVSVAAAKLHEENDSMNEIVNYHYNKISLVTQIENERAFTAMKIRDLLLEPTTLSAREIELIEESRNTASTSFLYLLQIENNERKRENIMNFQVINQAYEQDVREVLSLLKSGNRDGALHLFLSEEQKSVRTQIQARSYELQQYEHSDMHTLLTRSETNYSQTVKFMILLLALSLLVGIGVSIWTIRGFGRSISKVSRVIESVGNRKMDQLPRVEVISKDEIGAIALAYNQMAASIEQHAKQEEAFNQTLQDQNWVEAQFSKITTSFQGINDLETLSKLFINTITPLLHGNYGVFYSVVGNGIDKRINALSTYAYFGEQIKVASFRLGEGLIGQCVLDHQKIIVNEIPEDYVKIHSGLGSTTPKSIHIMPIEYEGSVLAVIEIASVKQFTPIQIKLLERLLESLGLTINSVIHQMRVKSLLEKSQSLTEELQAQSEELQMQHEELRSINEQIEKQYRFSAQKTQELEKTKLELEKKAEQLVTSSQYKSEFLANMSHELRTPLNSMLILAQLFTENREGNLTTNQMEYAHSIQSSGKELLNLINDILDLSKVESGKLDLLFDEIDLYGLERNLEVQFSPIAEKAGLDFTIEHEPFLSPLLITDEARLQQILNNLLSNAFKFTEKGRVELKFRKPNQLEFLERDIPRNTVIAISVSDTGIGIPYDKQALIFEAFRQADGTISRRHGGTGLGLSICRELANLLGGSIVLESQEGEGSTFTLYLPHKAIPEITGQQLVISEPSQRNIDELTHVSLDRGDLPQLQKQVPLDGKKILIVDDDMRNIFALTTLLEKENTQVIFAESGQEAIEKLKNNPDIDLVLMDIMMPEMDGYAAIRAIREIEDFETLPIIALTAKAMKNDRDKCIEAGASDYISKPIIVEQLNSLLRVWLYRKEG
jgi:two-component system, chemotaxis family, sensor kinase CheA